MKALKYLLTAVLLIGLTWGCQKEDTSLNFVSSAKAPANLAALYNVTQDNTGTVTIIPNGEGVAYFQIYFGDGTTEPVQVNPGKSVTHIYLEGTYDVKIVGVGITGLKSETTQPLIVSFKQPENLVATIVNDPAVSKMVHVTLTADWATMYEVYFGDVANEMPTQGNIGSTVSHQYAEAGTYTIRMVAKGAAIATTEISQDFVVTAIMAPIASAPAPKSRAVSDVISIFSGAYTNVVGTDYFPDWGQGGQGSSWAMFNLNGDDMLQYIKLSYQGIQFGSSVDASTMETLHIDVWTADVTGIDIYPIDGGGASEKLVHRDLIANQWNSFDIPLTEFTSQGLPLNNVIQFKFVASNWAAGTVFLDNIYFYKQPAPASGLEGTWIVAPEAGALKVGPAPGDGSWWSNSLADVTTRACYFDDVYSFSTDGTFRNILGNDTWLETWQGVASEQCGTPVAPHNGATPGSFIYDAGAGTITINGTGSYLGLPKVNNAGELPNVPVPNTITYNVVLSNNNNTMTVSIAEPGGVYWTYKLIRYISPIVGTWTMAPQSGALKVGPAPGDGSWWSNSLADVTTRSCYFDDEFVFNADGTFQNVLGTDTWLETWQGVASEQCGTPVAPYDGTSIANYIYDAGKGTLDLNGPGTYIGLPKANNAGELPNVAVPNAISYTVTLSNNNNTMTVGLAEAGGVYWTYTLLRK